MAEKPVCPYCKSDSVMKKATVVWDNENQEWVLLSVHDYAWCGYCEEDITNLEWIGE